MENLDEDLISTKKEFYSGFTLRNLDFNRTLILFQSSVIVLLLIIMVFIIPSFPSESLVRKDCRTSFQASSSPSDIIRDEAHFNISSSVRNYFDNGIENSCPILFKISGHDDYCYGKFTIPKPFNFFQNTYSFFYINTNGFVSFSYFDPSTVHKFPVSSVSMIAPFWSDIDLRFAGNIFHKEVNETDAVFQINVDINKRCPKLNYKSAWAYMVTWNDAPVYLSLDERYGSKFDYRNIFQVLLSTNGVQSFAIFNYKRLDWPNEKINSTFIAGYNAADTKFFVLENKDKSSLATRSNVNIPGRWVLPLNDNISC